MTALDDIRAQIIADPENAWATEHGWSPLYAAAPGAGIAINGQAPGRAAQESGIAWNDPSGVRLRDWLGIDEATFRDPGKVALLPMDFFYPGKGVHGDLPPRPAFAPRWHPPILAHLPRIRLTLLIGAYAQKHYLGNDAGTTLTETVRVFRSYLPGRIPLVHPSPLNFRWQAKNPWFDAELVPELRDRVGEVLA